jgi:general stress protein YciG
MSKNPHAVALGRKGGAATKGVSTPAKRRAARANGKKGGRPKKSQD